MCQFIATVVAGPLEIDDRTLSFCPHTPSFDCARNPGLRLPEGAYQRSEFQSVITGIKTVKTYSTWPTSRGRCPHCRNSVELARLDWPGRTDKHSLPASPGLLWVFLLLLLLFSRSAYISVSNSRAMFGCLFRADPSVDSHRGLSFDRQAA